MKKYVQQAQYKQNSGQAAIISVFFVMMIMLSTILGASSLALSEQKIANDGTQSRKSFFMSEATAEDAVYRIENNFAVPDSYSLELDGANAVITIASDGIQRTIYANASSSKAYRSAKIVMSSGNFSFGNGAIVGDGGLWMNNNSSVSGSVYSNGNIVANSRNPISQIARAGKSVANLSPTQQTTPDLSTNQYFGNSENNRSIAQSFTGAGGTLDRVAIYLGKIGKPKGALTVRITNDAGGIPTTASVANTVINTATVGNTTSWIYVAIPDAPVLQSGQKYWIVLDYNTYSSTNYWNWKKNSSDSGYANNTGKYTSNWSDAGAVWTNVGRDMAFKLWTNGSATSITGAYIGDASQGEGYANSFGADTKIHNSFCPNSYCNSGSANNSRMYELPFSDGLIQDWKNDALAGGTYSGDFRVSTNGVTVSLGPKKITGDLIVSQQGVLEVTGTLWIAGSVRLSTGGKIKLSDSYEAGTGVIISDGEITVSQDSFVEKNSYPNAFLIFLSTRNDPAEETIRLNNSGSGAIFYANNTTIRLANTTGAAMVAGYGIRAQNTASITYDFKLSDIDIINGNPAWDADDWHIASWNEIEPQ